MKLHRIEGTGLPNVFLENGYALEGEGEDQVVSYVDLDDLYRAVAASIAHRRAPLTGEEFKFLRRRMGMSQEQAGDMVGKTSQAVAKWEKGQAAVPVADGTMMRLAWLARYARRDLARAVEGMVRARDGVPGDYVYMHDGTRWTDSAAEAVFLPMFTAAQSEATTAIAAAQFKAAAVSTATRVDIANRVKDDINQKSEGMT